MGCCTSLLYGMTGASKNTVNVVFDVGSDSLTALAAGRPCWGLAVGPAWKVPTCHL